MSTNQNVRTGLLRRSITVGAVATVLLFVLGGIPYTIMSNSESFGVNMAGSFMISAIIGMMIGFAFGYHGILTED